MARIELRHCDVILQDGLSGTATGPAVAPAMGNTTLMISAVVLNTTITNQVPIGARFTIAGETAVAGAAPIHTVTARTPDPGSTTSITFSPSLGTGTYAASPTITFLPQQLTIKIGTGDITYTENNLYHYDLDRGNLDTVRQGDESPMDVTLAFTYEHITTGTNESIAPMDAIKRIGKASEWVSSATDKCEPYAVDILVVHTPPCGTSQKETTTFPDFRSEKRVPSYSKSEISVSGKCNATEPTVSRS